MLYKTFKKMFIAKIDVLNRIHRKTNCKNSRQTNLSISKSKFKSLSQQNFFTSRKHHIRNIWTVIKSIISSLNQKSDFWSSIFETFFSFENFSKILFTFLIKRFFFSVFAINSISIFQKFSIEFESFTFFENFSEFYLFYQQFHRSFLSAR